MINMADSQPWLILSKTVKPVNLFVEANL